VRAQPAVLSAHTHSHTHTRTRSTVRGHWDSRSGGDSFPFWFISERHAGLRIISIRSTGLCTTRTSSCSLHIKSLSHRSSESANWIPVVPINSIINAISCGKKLYKRVTAKLEIYSKTLAPVSAGRKTNIRKKYLEIYAGEWSTQYSICS